MFSCIYLKGGVTLIPVNKAEAKAIRERFPDAHVVRTCRQKSKRSHYYAEERAGILVMLSQMRREAMPECGKDMFNGYGMTCDE